MTREQQLEMALMELLRLYDWRFELAKREAGVEALDYEYRKETRRLLNQYGVEKKAAWAVARALLLPATTGSGGSGGPGTEVPLPTPTPI